MATSTQNFAAPLLHSPHKGTAPTTRIFFSLLLSASLLFLSSSALYAQCVPTLTATGIKQPTCGGKDGFFQVQAEGITVPYQYWLYKNGVLQENGTLIAGTLTFVGLTGGTYRVDVSKDGTCAGSVTVDLPQETLTLTATGLKQPTCGGKDGFFQVAATGITAPYQYWLYKNDVLVENGTLIAGTLTFVGLTGGTYRVDVSKGGTCAGSVTVELPQESLTLTATGLKYPTCGGKDGFFQVAATGITAPYQYWLYKNDVLVENGTLIAGTLTFVGLTGGTYRVDVSKGGTCSGSITVELPQETLSLTAVGLKQPTCGGKDGFFQVQATGITAPYQYYFYKNGVFQENGTLIAGTLTFVGLTGGTYRVDISKGGTCSGIVETVLTETPLTIALGNLTPPSCNGTDGSFSLNTTGITLPYQYTLAKQVDGSFVPQESGTLIAGSPTFVGLSAGIYQVTLTKGTCTGSFIVYLNCERLGNHGCTPGYWKHQTPAWLTTNFSPTQTVESVFNVPDSYGLDNTTLLQALSGDGGNSVADAALMLLRAATAAILNAAHPDVDYSIKMQQIITDVNAALASGNRNTMLKLANTLDKYNNKNCPIDASKTEFVRTAEKSDLQLVVAEFNVKALPNPTASYFNVQIEAASQEKASLRVVDVQGRLIEQRLNVQPGQTIRLGENYRAGVYLLEVQQGNSRKQLKLLKGFN